MIKKQAKIILLILTVLVLGIYVYFKSTEHSRFAEKAYKTFINIPETGLGVNEKQLEKNIKYADKKSIIYYQSLTILGAYVFN